jgi:D,D-heptose 1,7-bisphosphate phosphatase
MSKKIIDQAVIYVGGLGTRLQEITKKTPKPLISVNKKPFLNHLIKNLSRFGFKEVILLCFYKSEIFFKKYHNKNLYGIKVICVKEKKQLGTAGSLLNAKKFLDKNFLLCNGDTYFDINLNDLCFNFFKSKKEVFVALKKSKKNKRYDEFRLKKNRIVSIGKENKNYSILNSGYYIISKNVLKLFKDKRSLEKDVFKILIKKNKMYGKIYDNIFNKFIDIGIPKDLNKSSSFIKEVNYKSALFLDRDGVINKDTGYVHKKQNFQWRKNIMNFIKKYNDNNFLVFVITNQSGVGRRYYSETDVINLHTWVKNELRQMGANIDEFFYSPYYKKSTIKKYRLGKQMRKPNIGMINEIKKKWHVNMKNSLLIGDQEIDKQTAINAGIKFKILKYEKFLK